MMVTIFFLKLLFQVLYELRATATRTIPATTNGIETFATQRETKFFV